VVPERRAIVLVLMSKAVIEHAADDADYHSEKLSVPIPSVVRLKYFVKVPHRARTTLSRRAVFIRDGFECQYCGAAAENLDHILARSKGGKHTWENVVASCRPCNARKENRAAVEVGMRLRRAPTAPKSSLLLAMAAGNLHPAWVPYLEVAG